MMDELELKPTENEYNMIQDGYYRLSRVDVNEHFFFPSAQLARHGYVLRVVLQI